MKVWSAGTTSASHSASKLVPEGTAATTGAAGIGCFPAAHWNVFSTLTQSTAASCTGATLPGVARPGRATENLGGVKVADLLTADGVVTLLCSMGTSMRNGLNMSRWNNLVDRLICLKDGVRTSAASRREATASRRVMTASMETEGRQPRSKVSCRKQSE